MSVLEQLHQQDATSPFTPNTPQKGAAMARDATAHATPAMADDDEATPEEQAEYERAIGALGQVIYANDDTSGAVLDQLQPEDPIGSVAKAGILLVKTLDEKLQLDEAVIPQLTIEVADRLVDLAEAKFGSEFSEQEAQAVTGATWEGVMDLFGIDPEAYEEFVAGMSDEDIAQQQQAYKQFLGEA
jgi:hypothetical protein